MSDFFASLPSDSAFYLVGLPAIFLVAMSKGVFGCYLLLASAATKLLFDALRGLLA